MRTVLLWLFLLAGPFAHAELKWGFADLNLNHLDWDRGTEAKSPKRDFTYLEIEGGGVYSWGELYGFFDFENIGRSGPDVRTAGKGSIQYYLGASGLSLYAHVYNFAAYKFSEQNRVLGLGFNFGNERWWFKPFLGAHDVSQTYFSGANGFMGGWVFGWFLEFRGQKFLLADWHEFELLRARRYAAVYGGRRESQNGALSFWWIATARITPGVQWRYAVDKLGTAGSMGAVIYTVKYVF